MATENFGEVVVDMIEEDVGAFEDANPKANETIISALDENQFLQPKPNGNCIQVPPFGFTFCTERDFSDSDSSFKMKWNWSFSF